MKKALLIAPMASLHRRFNGLNVDVLKSKGYEVHIAANFNVCEGSEAANAKYEEQCRNNGIVTHNMDFYRAADLKNFRVVRELKKLLNTNEYDIVHAHSETGGLLLRMAMKKKHRYKAVYTPHGMSFYKGSSLLSQCTYRPAEKWICSAMDANIAMNGEEYDILKKWNCKTAYFVHGIGLDLEKFRDKPAINHVRQNLGISDDALIITAVGELNENKNHRVIIEALSKIENNNVYFLICGVGNLKKELERLAMSYGLKDKVKLLGYRDDIKDILFASDIFVFPSFHEGLPVSVMEAMCTELPVVCSDIRGNNDLIKEGPGGFLCAPNNAEAFSEVLKKLIADKKLRDEMGAYNANIIEAYGRENVAAELERIYV